jgi:hypothetical protein
MMKLTAEEGRDLIYDDLDGWERVRGSEETHEGGRWTTAHSAVFHHKPSGKHYELFWEQGATEQQEQSPFEYSEPEPKEVVEKEVVTKEWVPV